MKKTMKRIIAITLCVLFVCAAFVGCSSAKGDDANKDNSKSYKVGIAVLTENGAFTDMRDGIKEKLFAQYGEENVTVDYKSAAGDATTLTSIVSSFDDGSYDAVFTIATPATQAFVNLESSTPCFFCAVSDPVAAGVLTSLESPDKNATGTSNAIPVSDIIEMGYKMTADITKWGFIYSTSQVNSTSTVNSAKEYLEKNNKGLVSVKTVENSADVQSATQSLIDDGCDAIFVPNDSVVQDGIEALVSLCKEEKIPTYCSSATTVASGCLATLAIDDKGIGEKTAELAIKYFDGTAVAEIPSIVCGIDNCTVNGDYVSALSIETPTEDKIGYPVNVIAAK